MKITAVFVGAFVAASLGMPLETLVQHEKRTTTTTTAAAARMVKLHAAEPSAAVPVRIALAQRNLDRGMELLLAVADPDSPTYGQHYTQQQVTDTFAPAQQSVDAVRQWLVAAGIPEGGIRLSQSRGFLDFETTVSGLEALLQTSYHVYEDKRTASRHLGADTYHLPADVAPHVDYVWPAVASRRVKAPAAAPAVSPKGGTGSLTPEEIQAVKADPMTDCTRYVTPACIAAMYNIPPAPKTVSPKNALGVFEIDTEMYKQSDLDLFYETVAPTIPTGTGPKVDLIDLASTPSADQAVGEAAMDFDMAIPIIYPQGTELYQVQNGFHQFLEAVDSSYCDKGTSDDCGTFTPTTVISFSWGGLEDPKTVPETKRQCNEFMKLGLQGTTVVWSSGDTGVTGDGQACLGDSQQIFSVDDPAGCPYALTVGATILPKGRKPGDAEAVTESFSPGGGFSNIFPAPDYQAAALDAFFSAHDPGFPSYNATDLDIPLSGDGIYNHAGRGYPDISAVGDFGVFAFNGRVGLNAGTSMSAPIVAAILTRINEERLAAGKTPVGFVNPALYKKADVLRDVAEGRMRTDSVYACRGKSYSATPGWDPVTGLGVPDYKAMSEYLNGLP